MCVLRRKLFPSVILSILLGITIIAQGKVQKISADTQLHTPDLISINRMGRVEVLIISQKKDEDANDIDIQPFQVFLERNGILQEMQYQDNQSFILNVQEGLYNIIIKENSGDLLPFQRSNFYVSAHKVTKLPINIIEGGYQVCDKEYGVALIPNGSMNDNNYPLPKYEKFSVMPPYNLVIKFCEKSSTGQISTYKFALVTYKDITISSEELTFDQKTMIFESKNKKRPLWIEVGDCKKNNNLKLHLNDFEKIKCNRKPRV